MLLIFLFIAGTVIFRILKRTADFSLNTEDNVPQIQNKPLPLPKRSKLFLEQSMRERQNALGKLCLFIFQWCHTAVFVVQTKYI